MLTLINEMQWSWYLYSDFFFFTLSTLALCQIHSMTREKKGCFMICRGVHWFRKMCQLHLGRWLNKRKQKCFRKKKKRWSMCLLKDGICSSKCYLPQVSKTHGKDACVISPATLLWVNEVQMKRRRRGHGDPVPLVSWIWVFLQQPLEQASLPHSSLEAAPVVPEAGLWARLPLMTVLKLQPNSCFTGAHCSAIHS